MGRGVVVLGGAAAAPCPYMPRIWMRRKVRKRQVGRRSEASARVTLDRGRVAPVVGRRQRGDLIVEITIRVPESLSEDAQQKMREFAEVAELKY